jgi:aminoglycoside 3-N-acetyltransferase
MTVLSDIAAAIGELVPSDRRPVVVYSSSWPFLRQMGKSDLEAVESLLSCTLEALGDRTVLMPTFTRGYNNGVCNLDEEPSITGVMSECFRKRPGVQRTLSAFFSFAVSGVHHPELLELKAVHAWGPGSLYEWMEEQHVHFLMLGTHPNHCSYLHRLEWLARDVVTFRYDKSFEGRLVRACNSIDMTETLFVRRLDPPVVMDFAALEPGLREAGMIQQKVAGASIATFNAKAARECALPLLRSDPWAIVRNRQDYLH